MKKFRLDWTCLCLLGLCVGAWGEVPPPERVTLFDVERAVEADGSRGPYPISDRPLLEGSESVWVSDSLQVRDLDYLIDYAGGRLTFLRKLSRGARIRVRFQQIPRILRPVYRRREPPAEGASEAGGPPVPPPVAPRPPPGRTEGASRSADAPRLDIGGSKRIQVALGSDRDPALTQSLQVHITGEVAEGVELLALLSDRNLPLQPDGRTRSLQELDRVFFQVRSRSFSAGLGDLDVAFDGTSFGRYRRRLQGASLTVSLPGEGEVQLFGAVSEGRWVTYRIVPSEGYQGPYRLTGGEGGYRGWVVGGSERVYLDGRLLRRGEGQDYAIDYERGTVTFTPAQPISADSRITVEYQYRNDGGFRRRLAGLQSRFALADDRVRLGTTFIREADQVSAPSSVGLSTGMPLPSQQQLAVLDAAYAPLEGIALSGEVALSALNPNTLSPGDGENRRGRAFRLGFDLSPRPLKAGGRGLGRVRLTGVYRQIGARFDGFDRIDPVEMEGRWGWRPEAEGGAERTGEVALQYAPKQGIRLDLGYGQRRGSRSASRREAGMAVSRGRWADLSYRYEEVRQGDGRLSRQRGRASFILWKIRPGFRYGVETALGDAVREASLFYAAAPGGPGEAGGIRVRELAWDLSTDSGDRWSWRSELILRRTSLMKTGWRDSLRAWSHRHRGMLTGWHGLSLSGEYSRSAVRSPMRQGPDRHTDLARVRLGYAPPGGALSQQISYRISSTGASTRQPVFVYVGRGLGAYLWEDVNGDGLQDREEFVADVDGDYEVVYGEEGEFQPVREAALGARFEMALKRLLRSPRGAWLRLLAGLSIDLSLASERQILAGYGGAVPWDLYAFWRGPEVLRGRRDIQGRLYLFRYGRRASFRISARKRSRLDRAFSSGGIEDFSEAGAQARYRMGTRLDLEAELTGGRRGREGGEPFGYGIRFRAFSIRGLCRLAGGWRGGIRTGMGWEQEALRGLKIVTVSLSPEVIRALPGRGRIRGSMGWTRVSGAARIPLFLGMAQGNRAGHNLVWRLGVDYRLARYMTALLVYNGRKRPENPVLHVGRMEMRATF